jgi:hypothetical protein
MRFFRDEPTYDGAWRNSTEETLKKSSGTMNGPVVTAVGTY